jgi:hypothetical protein
MRRFPASACLALAAGVAHADTGMFDIGAGISRDNIKDVTATASDLDSTNWKVWAGFRPISMFAVEADYMDLGSKTVTQQNPPFNVTHVSYKAYSAYAVGFAPIPLPYLDVFGKVGAARWTASGSTTLFPGPGPFGSLSDNGTQFAWGIGTQVHVGNFGARLEYENFSIRNTNGANIVSLSVFLNLL